MSETTSGGLRRLLSLGAGPRFLSTAATGEATVVFDRFDYEEFVPAGCTQVVMRVRAVFFAEFRHVSPTHCD